MRALQPFRGAPAATSPKVEATKLERNRVEDECVSISDSDDQLVAAAGSSSSSAAPASSAMAAVPAKRSAGEASLSFKEVGERLRKLPRSGKSSPVWKFCELVGETREYPDSRGCASTQQKVRCMIQNCPGFLTAHEKGFQPFGWQGPRKVSMCTWHLWQVHHCQVSGSSGEAVRVF